MEEPPEEALQRADEHLDEWSQPMIDILWAITRWYNGACFNRDNKIDHIGWSRPPTLQTLLGCSDEQWQQQYAPTFEEMRNPGHLHSLGRNLLAALRNEETTPQAWFDDRYILRRKVKWDPTRKARIVMDALFENLIDTQQLPHHHIEGDIGLIGDWNETLLHRTGVEIVAAIWRQKGWQVHMYPGQPGQARPDIIARTLDNTTWAAEVLTAHHEPAMARDKFTTFAMEPDRNHLWLFETRRAGFRTLNKLHEHDTIECRIVNAPFEPPDNWSMQVGNDYIRKSRDDSEYACLGIDSIDTITGWYERFFPKDEIRRRQNA